MKVLVPPWKTKSIGWKKILRSLLSVYFCIKCAEIIGRDTFSIFSFTCFIQRVNDRIAVLKYPKFIMIILISLTTNDINLESCLVEHNLDAIMNLALHEFLCILGIQYISRKSFALILILNPNFLKNFIFSLINSHFLTFELVWIFFSPIIPISFSLWVQSVTSFVIKSLHLFESIVLFSLKFVPLLTSFLRCLFSIKQRYPAILSQWSLFTK